MLVSLWRSSVVGAVIVFVCSLFSFSTPALADGSADSAASRVPWTDPSPAPQNRSSSDQVLQVAQLADDNWVVRQVTAPVRREGTDRALAVGDRVATGDRLITGPGGRAVLVRRKDKISMSPNSDLKVGDSKGDRLFTNIIQTLGTLLFQVEKNPRQRFQVGTPYLAATVKGTTFTVNVRPEGAAVHVTNGAVQVAARGGKRAVIVRPGQTGSVSSKPGAEVEIRKRESKGAPATADSTLTEIAAQAENKASSGGGEGSFGVTKGLAAALGTGPSNFAKLTKGFAVNVAGKGKAGGNRNANAGGNSGKAKGGEKNAGKKNADKSKGGKKNAGKAKSGKSKGGKNGIAKSPKGKAKAGVVFRRANASVGKRGGGGGKPKSAIRASNKQSALRVTAALKGNSGSSVAKSKGTSATAATAKKPTTVKAAPKAKVTAAPKVKVAAAPKAKVTAAPKAKAPAAPKAKGKK